MAKTLSELLTTLRDEILIEPVPNKWSDAILETLINRGQTQVARALNCEYTRDATTDSVSGTQEYTLPNGFLRMYPSSRSVVYVDTDGNKTYPTPVSLSYLISTYGEDWKTETGTPDHYYVREGNKIGFYPKPNYTGTDNVYLYYFGEPASMSSAINCQLPDTCELAICYWAGKLAWDKINIPFNQIIATTSLMCRDNYNEELLELGTHGDFIEPIKMDYLNKGPNGSSVHTIGD